MFLAALVANEVAQFAKPFFFSSEGRGAGEAYLIYGGNALRGARIDLAAPPAGVGVTEDVEVVPSKDADSCDFYDGAADGRTWGFSGTGDVFSIYELEANWSLTPRGTPVVASRHYTGGHGSVC